MAETTPLLRVRILTGTEGSNPSLSAINHSHTINFNTSQIIIDILIFAIQLIFKRSGKNKKWKNKEEVTMIKSKQGRFTFWTRSKKTLTIALKDSHLS